MSKIQDLFVRSIDRKINSVVSIDDGRDLRLEFEEYVVTTGIKGHLDKVLTEYLALEREGTAETNAVWISGYYGSGKSHLLKMLSRLLPNTEIADGKRAADYVAERLEKFGDAVLLGDLQQAVMIPSESVYFNIGAAANALGVGDQDRVVLTFRRQFYEHCGYYGRLPYVAAFELDLDGRGLWQRFQDRYREKHGRDWQVARKTPANYGLVDEIYNELTGESRRDVLTSPENPGGERGEQYSAKDFCEEVGAYLKRKSEACPNLRLNFFVDEVGQFIGTSLRMMLSLQEIATGLKNECHGRAWLFVTAQENLDQIIGKIEKQDENLGKISDRFQIKIPLDTANVNEVIETRLLEKKTRVLPELRDFFEKHSGQITAQGQINNVSDKSGAQYQPVRTAETFTAVYPLLPYMIGLLQESIGDLSKTNRMLGMLHSVGERSLLGILQGGIRAVEDQPLGCVVTFDRLYDALDDKLKTVATQRISKAINQGQLEDLAEKALKCLFLIKSSQTVDGTLGNLTTMLQDDLTADRGEFSRKVQKQLDILVSQRYASCEADKYSFLTDEEQEVDEQIRRIVPSMDEFREVLSDHLFGDGYGLSSGKIKNPENSQTFGFRKFVDDVAFDHGRGQNTLGICLVSFDNEQDTQEVARLSNTDAGRDKVYIIPDRVHAGELYGEIEKYLQTRTFCRSHQGAAEAQRQVIEARRAVNDGARRAKITELFKSWVDAAGVYVWGLEFEPRLSAAERIKRAFVQLVNKTYTEAVAREATLEEFQQACKGALPAALDAQTASEVEAVRAAVQEQWRGGASGPYYLTKLMARQQESPRGWPDNNILRAVALLARQGKIKLWHDGAALPTGDLYPYLNNSRRRADLTVQLEVEVDPLQIHWLKELCRKLQDIGADSGEAGRMTTFDNLKGLLTEWFYNWAQRLETLYPGLPTQLPCRSQGMETARALRELAGKDRDFYASADPAQGVRAQEMKIIALGKVAQAWCEGGVSRGASVQDGLNNFEVVTEAYRLARDLQNDGEFTAETAALQEILQQTECYLGQPYRDIKDRRQKLRKHNETVLGKRREESQRRDEDIVRQLKADTLAQHPDATDKQKADLGHLADAYLRTRRQQGEQTRHAAEMLVVDAQRGGAEEQLRAQVAQLFPPPPDVKKEPQKVSFDDLCKTVTGYRELATREEVDRYVEALRQVLAESVGKQRIVVLTSS